ncbi:ATP-binding protein [Profundibacterium mesophilum]|uniref:ATP-binding region ATPase domain protein n=1 Tax=Profundibacterium mesophilum KAUST100406-0324 TaxID=1037889 RepID=A0A921NS04_9RHOB|nr:ATP-binding protein [Profundibacterium mesophilum]KAF0676682.1 ATP-binding region ATPase domain protein [Profundibacterium mesophilum KAUST100406-0324]
MDEFAALRFHLDITDPSAVSASRRFARSLAQRLGIGEERAEKAAIVASEMATNLLKHVGRGKILMCGVLGADGYWLSMAAIDAGPGISDIADALRDGVSSSGTGGSGLGAISRLGDRFDIHSRSGEGTVVLAEFGTGIRSVAGVTVGAFLQPHPAETSCGDGWYCRDRKGTLDLGVVDGLGHGSKAELAADEVIDALRRQSGGPASAIMGIGGEMLGNRGAVVGVACIEAADHRMSYCSLGNIAAMVITRSGKVKRLIGRAGRIGGRVPELSNETCALAPGDTVVLHSDGIATLRREPAELAPLMTRSPALIAAVLQRDGYRERDDACVAVARITDAPHSQGGAQGIAR